MESILKKVESAIDRIPEGIQRARATVEGRPFRCNPRPFLLLVDIFPPFLSLRRVEGVAIGVRGVQFLGVDHTGIANAWHLVVVNAADLVFHICYGSRSYIPAVLQVSWILTVSDSYLFSQSALSNLRTRCLIGTIPIARNRSSQ